MTAKIAKVAVAASAFGSINLAAVPPAHAYPEGTRCSLTAASDPTGEGDVYTGEVEGGPLAAASADPNNPWADPTASMTLTCTVQVGPTGRTHAGPDAASASATGTGAVVLPPTQISYVAPEDVDVYLCTEVTVNGTAYYYDETNAVWSTSSSVDCALAIAVDTICVRSYHQGELVTWDTGWACVQARVEPR